RPEVSSASPRVSDTVRTAIWTGWNRRPSSIRPATAGSVAGGHEVVLRLIGRPAAGGHAVEARRPLVQPVLVNPVVGHHALDEVARLPVGQALQEQERVCRRYGRPPLDQTARPGVVADAEHDKVAIDARVLQ